MPRRLSFLAILLVAIAIAVLSTARRGGAQDGGWVIDSFVAGYDIQDDGSIRVTEDIRVDFGTLQKHGIFRDVPVRYAYDSEHDRAIAITDLTIDNGEAQLMYTSSTEGPYLRLKIGDPDATVSGKQRYRISYVARGAMNPFDDHDELYWNATGNGWPVPVQRAEAIVTVPVPSIQLVACYEGRTGSTEPCVSTYNETAARFLANRPLGPNEGLTIVVGLSKGAVTVPPLRLVAAEKSRAEQAKDFFELTPAVVAVTMILALAVVAGLARLWWRVGRDRWYGDLAAVTGESQEEIRPLLAHTTLVVQYEPPDAPTDHRRLRPAEIGLLVDERADTLDVSATIVDLAVRKYLLIKELPKDGLLGYFRSQDYELERLDHAGDDLLPYERVLLNALFDDESIAKLSELKNKFHEDLATVKNELYEESEKRNNFFIRNPDGIRTEYRLIGAGALVIGGGIAFLLGAAFGAAAIGMPIIVGGLALIVLAHLMPRRTAQGWETYRRCLGFRLYMVTAETDRQRFAEQANIFHEYLPYAIVFNCTKKWAEAFEQLGLQPEASYYVGTHPFVPMAFVENMNDFSSSISQTMASTPGGSGGSGFSGGFSGGGVGGGGGGSW